ncbi:uncharacterized protein LOC114262440 isoform X1 [Camellia sinensis]|uniref:uncharacterized protein LOC114262440 isoform X1 n=1 Tax=Camellia sinensis TaxID=4442 RepID=UPI0010356947|nr:uncharacterized protein LOC114262440 isoform X1 [Camellia sinensis]
MTAQTSSFVKIMVTGLQRGSQKILLRTHVVLYGRALYCAEAEVACVHSLLPISCKQSKAEHVPFSKCDEMVSINSVKTATRHVGFKLEGNASSRLEKMLPSINKTSGSIIGNYLNPVSPSCTTINDNVVNFYEARQRAARAIRMTVP